MNAHQQLIKTFYSAFQNLDYKTMQGCYHEHAVFYDPVFEDLNAAELRKMWQMLCTNAKNFSMQFSSVEADEEYGNCNWTATYSFSKTGRTVVNKVRAHMKFSDGKIIEHTDDFDLWKWSRQALGLSGWVLGWSAFMQNKIRSNAQASLAKYMQQESPGRDTAT